VKIEEGMGKIVNSKKKLKRSKQLNCDHKREKEKRVIDEKEKRKERRKRQKEREKRKKI